MRYQKNCLLLLLVVLAAGAHLSAQSRTADGPDKAGWRFEFSNDIFFHSDNNLTSGLALQLNSASADRWDDLRGVPAFVRRLGWLIPMAAKDNKICRFGLGIGQVVQTPDDLGRSDLILDDVPYAGVLSLQASWYAYNAARFDGFELTLGVSGPLSLAGQAQRGFHKLIHCALPMGWDNQLASEFLLNLNYMGKRRFLHTGNPAAFSGDASAGAVIALGNLFTHASADLELRAGLNMPAGFVYVPDPIGFGMHYQALFKPVRQRKPSGYLTLTLRGTALMRTFFLDGNTFADSHRVDRRHFIGQLAAGLHFAWGPIALSFCAYTTTPIVYTDRPDNCEQFGTIAIEWHF